MIAIVILHGWQSSPQKWQKVAEILAKEGIEVVIPDIPGFKEELALNRPWNLDDYVRWLEEFCGGRSRPFFLLGHSFGGRIAIKFAAKNSENSEKLNGLILVSSAGLKPKRTLYINIISAVAKAGSKLSFLPGFSFCRKIFYKFIVGKTDYLNVKGNLKGTFQNIVSEDLAVYLPKIKVPTLLIWGDKDKITPLSDAFLIKEKIPNSKLEILKKVGHLPYLESPELLSRKILEFLRQNIVFIQ